MTNIITGKTAPAFTLKDMDGPKKHSLDTLLQAGPLVVAFFKVSCPVCQFTFPFLERIHQRHRDETASFLGISQDDASATREFARKYGLTFPMALDPKDYPASNTYEITTVPTIFLIDTSGTIKLTFTGFDKSGLEQLAADLAHWKNNSAIPLFQPDEKVPDHKPG